MNFEIFSLPLKLPDQMTPIVRYYDKETRDWFIFSGKFRKLKLCHHLNSIGIYLSILFEGGWSPSSQLIQRVQQHVSFLPIKQNSYLKGITSKKCGNNLIKVPNFSLILIRARQPCVTHD